MAPDDIPPKYDARKVEAVMLELVTELHPTHLTKEALAAKVIADADDRREVRTAREAINGLREFGLIHPRLDDIVEPTVAALHAVALLKER